MTLHLFKPPLHSTGVYSNRLSEALSGLGVPSKCRTAGSDRFAGFVRKMFPPRFSEELLPLSTRPMFAKQALAEIQPGDVASVYTNSFFADRKVCCPFERALKKAGAKYVFHLPDAWPAIPRWKPHVDERIRLADFVATVTPELTEMVRQIYPGVVCDTCEEAVATEDLEPEFESVLDPPVVVWSGPPGKIREVENLLPVLELVHKKSPFTLRIVSGSRPPNLSASIPIHWMPFFGTPPSERFKGAEVAFARYTDTPYGRCKGNYKVKTYMAAGCAVVTSPVGYNLELVEPGVTGLFASSPAEWADSFLHLLRNPDERLAMREAARETAVRRFSYAAVAAQYAGILRKYQLV